MKKLSLILVLATNFAVAQFQPMKQKNKPNGYPGLNRFGKIDTNQLPPVKAPILPAMVNSFNGRTGAVLLEYNDVVNSLGYVPASQFGGNSYLTSSSSLNWNNVVNTPSTFPSNWNTLINKPSNLDFLGQNYVSQGKRVPVFNRRNNTYQLQRGLTRSLNYNDINSMFWTNSQGAGGDYVVDDSTFRNNPSAFSSSGNIVIAEIGYAAATGNRSNNVIIGELAAQQITAGAGNFYGGFQAARNKQVGDDNVYLGRNVADLNSSSSNSVVIGALSGRTTSLGNNCIVLGASRGNSINGNNQLDIGGWITGNNGKIVIGSSNIPSSTTSAVLQLDGVDGGFLPNRLTPAQANAIANKIEGLIVYITATDATFTRKGWYGWNGTIWEIFN